MNAHDLLSPKVCLLINKYLDRPNGNVRPWYQFVCKQGKVPVISGGSIRANWPLSEEFSRSILLLHLHNWRIIADIKGAKNTWADIMTTFLNGEHCPNFVKADVEKAKRHRPEEDIVKSDPDEANHDEGIEQHQWMDLSIPNSDYVEPASAFVFVDGGPDYDFRMVILLEDDVQLPPVCDAPVYHSSSKAAKQKPPQLYMGHWCGKSSTWL